MHTEEKPCTDTTRRLPPESQGEKHQEKPNLWIPWTWTSRLQNCKKINFCYLILPVVFCYGSPRKLIHHQNLVRIKTTKVWGNHKTVAHRSFSLSDWLHLVCRHLSKFPFNCLQLQLQKLAQVRKHWLWLFRFSLSLQISGWQYAMRSQCSDGSKKIYWFSVC